MSYDKKLDDTAEQINERLDGAGGCTEAWEALSGLRSSRSEVSVGRRRFIHGLGAVGVSTTALSDIGAAKRGSKLSTDMLKGNKLKAAISSMNSDANYQTLRSFYENSGWVPLVNQIRGVRSEHRGDSHRTVVVPFENSNKNRSRGEQLHILWLDNEAFAKKYSSAIGHHAIKSEYTALKRTSEGGKVYQIQDWKLTKSTANSGEVTSQTGYLHDGNSNTEISTNAVLLGDGGEEGAHRGKNVTGHGLLVEVTIGVVS